MSSLTSLRNRNEWQFFAALPKADARLAFAWWAVVVLRGILPALFAISMGVLVGAVQRGAPLAAPLVVVGVIFVLLQVLAPIQTAVSHNLGDRTAAFLYDRLTSACARPDGIGHLESPGVGRRPHGRARFRSRHDRSAAVVFDGLHRRRPGQLIGGLAAAVVLLGSRGGRRSCSPPHGSRRTGSCAKARCGTIATPTKCAPRSATPTTRIAWRSIHPRARNCGFSASSAGRSIDSSHTARRLHELQYQATRLRERPLAWSLLIVTAANVIVVLGDRGGASPAGRLISASW